MHPLKLFNNWSNSVSFQSYHPQIASSVFVLRGSITHRTSLCRRPEFLCFDMDTSERSLWPFLPSELVELVLSYLSTEDLHLFQPVCREALLLSSQVLEQRWAGWDTSPVRTHKLSFADAEAILCFQFLDGEPMHGVVSTFEGLYTFQRSEDGQSLIRKPLNPGPWIPYFEFDSRFLIAPESTGKVNIYRRDDESNFELFQVINRCNSRVITCHLKDDFFIDGSWDHRSNWYKYSNEEKKWQQVHSVKVPGEVQSVTFDDRFCYVGEGSGGANQIYLYDLQSQKQVKILDGMTDWIIHMDASDPRKLYTAGSMNESAVRVWDKTSGEQVQRFATTRGRIRRVIQDDVKLITASSRGFLHVWDIRNPNKFLHELTLSDKVDDKRYRDERTRCCQWRGNSACVSIGTAILQFDPQENRLSSLFK